MGGAVVLKRPSEIGQRIREFQQKGGAVPAPSDCWLILRGFEALVARMRIHCENAGRVAEFLSGHKSVSVVHYPGLASNDGYAVAKRQMRDFGGMLSFEVRGGKEEALNVTAGLKLIIRATSLGGTHTLVEHRASIEGSRTHALQNRC
jgi:cystathionine gamma-synthase